MKKLLPLLFLILPLLTVAQTNPARLDSAWRSAAGIGLSHIDVTAAKQTKWDSVRILRDSVTALRSSINGIVPATRTVNGKALSTNITITKADVGLDSVNNTPDIHKPISDAQQTAINTKLTGTGASDVDAQVSTNSGLTEDGKFISRLKLVNWWTWARSQPWTWGGVQTFSSAPVFSTPLIFPAKVTLTTAPAALTAASPKVLVRNPSTGDIEAMSVAGPTATDSLSLVKASDPRMSNARTPTAHGHSLLDINTTGTPSATTFLRGDSTWATPAGGGSITVDTTPTDGSANPVESNGVFDGLAGKVNTSDLNEAVDDRIAATIVAGSNVTVTYNDGANTLTIASTGSGTGVTGMTEPSTNGIVTRAGSGTVVARSLEATTADIVITNPTGLTGNYGVGTAIPATKRAYYEQVLFSGNLLSSSGTGTLALAPNGSGAGGTFTSGTPLGIFGISTGTSTTGYTWLGTSGSFFNPNGTTKLAIEAVISIPNFSDGTDTYAAYVGFTNNITNAGNGVWFTVATSSIRGRSVLSSAVQGSELGSGTQTTNTLYRLRIEFNGTTAKYFMKAESSRQRDLTEWPWALDNSDVIGTYTDGSGGIDFASGPYGIGMFNKKSAGSNPRLTNIDQVIISKVN